MKDWALRLKAYLTKSVMPKHHCYQYATVTDFIALTIGCGLCGRSL